MHIQCQVGDLNIMGGLALALLKYADEEALGANPVNHTTEANVAEEIAIVPKEVGRILSVSILRFVLICCMLYHEHLAKVNKRPFYRTSRARFLKAGLPDMTPTHR